MVAALKNIKRAQGYWNDVRHVYEEPPDEFDKTRLPAMAVTHVPAQSRRQNVGHPNSNTVAAEMAFILRAVLRNDSADRIGPRKQQMRMLQDIHKALTADRTLGLARVRGIAFPAEPNLDSGALTGKTDTIILEYGLSVTYSYDDNLP